jgi:SWI/SNF-related matrix-associated actin-dependent regulator of chromatin subfamily A3
MLALILATKADVSREFSNCTLIGEWLCGLFCFPSFSMHSAVAPLSVLSNWEKQIEDHCVPGSLTSYVYYGTKRDINPKELQKYDVVITTYQTVAGEYDDKDSAPSKKKKKTEKSLFDVQWKVNYQLWSRLLVNSWS